MEKCSCVVWKWDIVGKCHRQLPFCLFVAIVFSHHRFNSNRNRNGSSSFSVRRSINCCSYLVVPGLVCSIIIPSISSLYMSFRRESISWADFAPSSLTLPVSPSLDEEMNNPWQHKCANMFSLSLQVLLLLFKHRKVSYEQNKGTYTYKLKFWKREWARRSERESEKEGI